MGEQGVGPSGVMKPVFASTVIATVGRPTLGRAVRSVLEQQLPGDDFEVIVVNDSGRDLPEADWQGAAQVHVFATNRQRQSVARNAGAALASGRYLHFLDDDDWLEPGAFAALRELGRREGDRAAWLYGATRLVDRHSERVIVLRHGLAGNVFAPVMAGEWIPLQSSLIDAGPFFACGGFNPRLSGPEDVDLVRRFALRHALAYSDAVVACVGIGRLGTTTDYVNHARLSRWAREGILNESGVLSRLRTSARSSAWRGRAARLYLTSALWNGRRGKLGVAVSRVATAVVLIAAAGAAAVSPAFWSAVFRGYQSDTFARGLSEPARAAEPEADPVPGPEVAAGLGATATDR